MPIVLPFMHVALAGSSELKVYEHKPHVSQLGTLINGVVTLIIPTPLSIQILWEVLRCGDWYEMGGGK